MVSVAERMRGLTYTFVAAALVLTCFLAALVGPQFIAARAVSPFTNPADFRAFYCAGQVLWSGHDPYRVEPLRTCQQAAAGEMGLTLVPGLVLPAPLPPYALAAFGLLGQLPFANAVALWFWLLFISTLGMTVLLRKMTGLPFAVIAVVWTVSVTPAVLLGQMVPIVAFFIVSCAYLLRKKQHVLAGISAAATMIEPHLGFPCCVVLFVLDSRTRRTLVICALASFAVMLANGGWSLIVEYATRELPSHARSELFALHAQYSLSTFLAVADVAPQYALLWGQLDYVFMLVLGFATARALSKRFADPSFFALLPPGFVLLGGIYIHVAQLIAALPLAAVLYARAAYRRRLAAAYLTSMCGVVAAILIDVFYENGLVNAITNSTLRSLAAIDASGLASEVARVWQTARMPHDASTVCMIAISKAPGLFGLLMLIIGAVSEAHLRRRDAPSVFRGTRPAKRGSYR